VRARGNANYRSMLPPARRVSEGCLSRSMSFCFRATSAALRCASAQCD